MELEYGGNKLSLNFKIPLKKKTHQKQKEETLEQESFQSPLSNLSNLSSTNSEIISYQPPPPPDFSSAFSNAAKRKLEPEANIRKWFGKDPSYPLELRELIQPLCCNLCKAQLNSIKTAHIHYVSKVHNKKVSNWLTEWSSKTGQPAPKIQKVIKDEPLASNDLICKICDLKLTSLHDAHQHYNGKKHKMVASGLSKPSGSGYYDKDNNWIRTITNIKTNERFGIGESFSQNDTKAADKAADNSSKHCEICNIFVTSEQQMEMHLKGSKHLKKVKLIALTVDSDTLFNHPKIEQARQKYVTPSGSYYCKSCNLTLNGASIFNQHLQSKKHKKSVSVK